MRDMQGIFRRSLAHNIHIEVGTALAFLQEAEKYAPPPDACMTSSKLVFALQMSTAPGWFMANIWSDGGRQD
ncbi:hypothetical protein E4T66_04365 [Sinimarinibacterium sp. CAU 1509]|uniref:hypothetical protein n=1 Tax=Sinimarinibacterium sp. CAU 1509 TaxID=2562283 RepID=UPI0010ACAE40|nr:hypothetical protein [Sinimarinibacterium sp. CAU 1509]TJY62955.1 hypothetical protein E4T66_04365 [Sinimarinibacterium sp. CAU 1509]